MSHGSIKILWELKKHIKVGHVKAHQNSFTDQEVIGIISEYPGVLARGGRLGL